MGFHYDPGELDQEGINVLEAWSDWNMFGILPWDKNARAEDVPLYWKNALRQIDKMHNQAKENLDKQKVDSDIAGDISREESRKRSIRTGR